MSFPRYPEYKDSGVNLLEAVPAHWELTRFKRIFREREDRSECGNEMLLSVSAYTGVTPRSEVVDDGDYLSRAESLEGYKVCFKDDLVMNIMLAWNRGLAFTQYEGIVSPAYCVFSVVNGSEPKFLNFLVRSDEYTLYFKAYSSGVIDSRLRIYPDTFGRLFCALPPIHEQTQIAAFLDRETAKIDALVAEQRRLMALLKEKRQAVISHAVTRGLNPDAPMKPSGIEWLGDVPAHWEVLPIKKIVSVPITDGPHETPNFIDDGVPFVSAEAVSSGSINFSKVRACISEEDNARYSLKYAPKLHDIYMVKSGATTGITAIVEDRTDFNIWSPLAAIRCHEGSVPHFVLNFMRSKHFQEAVTLNWSFGTQQNIGMGVIENLACTVPPVAEQHEIAQILKTESAKFDTLTTEAQRAIDLLQERRTALISAAVTGQIDVRGAAQ